MMNFNRLKARIGMTAAAGVVMMATAVLSANAGAAVPSGEVQFANNVVEPVYNDLTGGFAFLLTPENAHVNANSPNVADIYIVMYPTEVANTIGGVNCQHQPADNCPDHGPAVAGLAEAMVPSVYGNGVWGHDHLASMPAAPPVRGGEFNPTWLPIVVLFKTMDAVTHVTTLDQLNQLRAAGAVTEVPLPGAIFLGSPASASAYARGTPVDPAPPTP